MRRQGLILPAAFLVAAGLHAWLLLAHLQIFPPRLPPASSTVFRLVNAIVVKPSQPPSSELRPESPEPAELPEPTPIEAESPPPEPSVPQAPHVVERQPEPPVPPPRQRLPPSQLRPQLAARATAPPPDATGSPVDRFLPFNRVDRRPGFLRRAVLEYPVQAKRQNIEGSVVVEAEIDEAGELVEARVVRGAGFGLDEAALAYILRSTYSPAYAGGRPVAVRMRFTIRFSLR